MELALPKAPGEFQAITMVQLTEQAIAQIVLPIEVSSAIVAPDVRARHQQQVAALAEEYSGLTIASVDDEDGFNRVQKAITRVTGVATGIDKARKAVTAPWDTAKKQVDGYASQLEDQVRNTVLKPLQSEKDRILNERKAIAMREQQAREQRIADRKAALHALNFGYYGGMEYRHNLPGVDAIAELWILDKSDEEFEAILNKAADQVKAAADAKARADEQAAEQKRIAEEEFKRQQDMAAENQRKADELKAKEEQINAQIRTTRIDALKARGMVEERTDRGVWLSVGEMSVLVNSLHELGTGQFDNLCRDAEDEKQRWDAECAMLKAKAEEDRLANEKRIADEAAAKERARIETEARQKAEQEAERLKQAGDAGALEALIHHLTDTPWPQRLQSEIAKHGLNTASKHIANAVAVLMGTVRDLK